MTVSFQSQTNSILSVNNESSIITWGRVRQEERQKISILDAGFWMSFDPAQSLSKGRARFSFIKHLASSIRYLVSGIEYGAANRRIYPRQRG
jgi:hypothetical protein